MNETFDIYETLNNSGNGQGEFLITVESWNEVKKYCRYYLGSYYVVHVSSKTVSMVSYMSLFQGLLEDLETSTYRLSKETGIPESTITRYFRGETDALKMSLLNAGIIANMLNISIDNLYALLTKPEEFSSLN